MADIADRLAGNSLPLFQFNNRRSAFGGVLPDPTPEVVSIFDWQR